MKLKDLFEAATSELYHSTRLSTASFILNSGYFKLTASAGTAAELQFHKPGKFYYLSTSRSKVGDYTLRNHYLDGVVFNLDGNWLNHKYTSAPVDYWERSWIRSDGSRTSEAEDRIYSREPTIPFPTPATKLIKSVHILYEIDKIKNDDDQNRLVWLRKTLLGAKRLGIPVYVYKTPNDWLTQNPGKRIETDSLVKSMRTVLPQKSWGRVDRDYFKEWRELYYKNDMNSLSKEGKSKMWKLLQYSQDLTNSLSADIHNSRTKNDPGLIKLLKIFNKLGFTSPKQYIEFLKDKWDKILKTDRK